MCDVPPFILLFKIARQNDSMKFIKTIIVQYSLHNHSRFQAVCLSIRHETCSPVSGRNHRCSEEKVQAQSETDRQTDSAVEWTTWQVLTLVRRLISTQGLPSLWVETAPKWPSNCVNKVMRRIGSVLTAAWVSRLITNPPNAMLHYVRFVFWNCGAALSDVMALPKVHMLINLFRVYEFRSGTNAIIKRQVLK
jgi:hypothetical protein